MVNIGLGNDKVKLGGINKSDLQKFECLCDDRTPVSAANNRVHEPAKPLFKERPGGCKYKRCPLCAILEQRLIGPL